MTASVPADQYLCSARSWLFSPGNSLRRLASAMNSKADVLIVDLEDSVPHDEKKSAREMAFSFISESAGAAKLLALRINPVDTRAGLNDLCELLDGKADPDFLIVPKAEFPSTFEILDRQLSAAGKKVSFVALIESASGLQRISAIAGSTSRMYGLMFGAADMAADLGCECNWEALRSPRSTVVVAAAAAGIRCIDAPFFALQDISGLANESIGSRSMGFVAKAAIHPNQLDSINEIWTPTDQEISDAKEIVRLSASGVAVYKGKMVDEAMAKKARRILAASGSVISQ